MYTDHECNVCLEEISQHLYPIRSITCLTNQCSTIIFCWDFKDCGLLLGWIMNAICDGKRFLSVCN
jgi:hypothetical protein